MTKEERMKYMRQVDLIDVDKLRKASVSIIGLGSVGSFTALAIAKMGVGKVVGYDEDGVSIQNLPAQFFKNNQVKQFKSDAMGELLSEFTDAKYVGHNKFYTGQKLQEYTIVVTDNMASRKLVWEQFLKQKQAKYLIEARMGAKMFKIYTIKDKTKKTRTFYESTLHSDEKSHKLPCTARTIIYNVLTLSGCILKAFETILMKEHMPKEFIFNMTRIDPLSLMLRD